MSLLDEKGLGSYLERVLGDDSAIVRYRRGGDPVLLHSIHLKDLGLRLVIEGSEEEVTQPALETLVQNVIVGAVLTVILLVLANSTLKRYEGRVRELEAVDSLTGAVKRSAFDLLYDQAVSAATRRGAADIAIVVVGLDHFRKLNDTYGRLAGDEILHGVATIARRLDQDVGRFLSLG